MGGIHLIRVGARIINLALLVQAEDRDDGSLLLEFAGGATLILSGVEAIDARAILRALEEGGPQ